MLSKHVFVFKFYNQILFYEVKIFLLRISLFCPILFNVVADLKIANKNFFQRILFVNYNAWHYVGCDVLWAGIVKALAEKVEEEFGKFTTRLFRAIALETECEPEHQDDQSDRLRIQFSDDEFVKNMSEEEIVNRLKEYDVLDSCEVTIKQNDKCWEVKCNNANDAFEAKTKLQVFRNIEEVSYVPPPATNSGSNVGSKDKRSSYTGQKIYCGFRIKNILKTIGSIVVLLSSAVLFGISFTSDVFQVLS